MSDFNGTSGSDNFVGTNSVDVFDLDQGGNDTANGLAGNDEFDLGATFTFEDRIDGGTGTDTLVLNGDYSAGLNVKAATLAHVEIITLAAGHDYKISFNDANFVSGDGQIDIRGYTLGAADNMIIDGSHETTNSFNFHGGAADDTFYGG